MMKQRGNQKFIRVMLRGIKYGAPVLATVYLCLCISMRLPVRAAAFPKEECMVYYIVNADGMKGLGHSILLLVDGEGCGTALSFNGMQRSLGECLLGKSGIGKLSMGTMTAEETEAFLQSGDLSIAGDQLTDNYDMALYRPITMEDYNTILEQTVPYRETEQDFAVLYGQWAAEETESKKAEYEQALKQMGEDESLPLYQIYTNNCDHVARGLASSVDPQLQEYTAHAWRITPNGNLKAFGKEAENWGVMELGEQSLKEKILMFLVSF